MTLLDTNILSNLMSTQPDPRVSFDLVAAREYGQLMAHRRKLGMPMSVADGQIASIARVHTLDLATRNIKDFQECGVAVIDPFSSGR